MLPGETVEDYIEQKPYVLKAAEKKQVMNPSTPFVNQKSAMERMIDFSFYMVRFS